MIGGLAYRQKKRKGDLTFPLPKKLHGPLLQMLCKKRFGLLPRILCRRRIVARGPVVTEKTVTGRVVDLCSEYLVAFSESGFNLLDMLLGNQLVAAAEEK
jgi:hypothetical protein